MCNSIQKSSNLFSFIFSFFLLCVSLQTHAADELSLKVITSSESSLHANFTLVIGEKDMVLIDAPFTKADAHRLVADMLESGRSLKYLFITHDHPDHFWAMQVVMDAYPEAKVVAHPDVVADIWRSIPFKIIRWSPMLGNNGPAYPTAPTAMTENFLELEGHRLEVIGPMQGDHHNATAIWIPDMEALVAGDLVFHGIHPWLGEALEDRRLVWLDNLETLIALEAKTVVAGHKLPGMNDGPESLIFTRDYIINFNREAKLTKNSEVLIRIMRELYPNVGDVLDNFILLNSAQVGVGELPPWEE